LIVMVTGSTKRASTQGLRTGFNMRASTAEELKKLVPKLKANAYSALLCGETVHNIEQALESELIYFLQINGENESLQLVVDKILKSLLDGVGLPGTFDKWQVLKS